MDELLDKVGDLLGLLDIDTERVVEGETVIVIVEEGLEEELIELEGDAEGDAEGDGDELTVELGVVVDVTEAEHVGVFVEDLDLLTVFDGERVGEAAREGLREGDAILEGVTDGLAARLPVTEGVGPIEGLIVGVIVELLLTEGV